MNTPIDMTSTPAGPWLALFALIAFGIVTIVGDGITTMVGLGAKKGFVEGNPLARWLFSKIGESLTVWLSAVVYALLAAFIGSKAWGPGMFFAGTVAVSEAFFTIKNYRLLKSLGIPLK